MAAAPRRWAAELLHFWFHKLKPRDWFGGGDTVDRQLQTRFGRDLAGDGLAHHHILETQVADELGQDLQAWLGGVRLGRGIGIGLGHRSLRYRSAAVLTVPPPVLNAAGRKDGRHPAAYSRRR